MTTGRPMRSTTSWASSMVWAVPEAGRAQADLGHGHLELLAVLGGGDGGGVGADQLDAFALEHARLDQLHGQVERGLAAQGGQQGVGVLALDDLGQDLDVERLHVGGVREVGVGHDGGRVGVGQDDPVALLPQHPAGLGARVVELAGLPDDDGARPDEQDRLDVVATRHQASCFPTAGHELVELGEQVAGVVGTGPGLGVVLHAEGRHLPAAEALDGAVVEVAMRDLDAAGQGVEHGEVVVLAGDLDRPRVEAAHRVVAAVMAEGQLEDGGAQGAGQQLVAQADAEDGHLAEQLADGVRGVAHGGRVAGSVGQEHAVGLASQHLGGRGGGRHHLDGGDLAQLGQDGPLDAEVVGHHPTGAVADRVRLGAGDGGHQVDAVGARLGPGRVGQLVDRGGAEGAGHGARGAQVAGQATGVDPGDAGQVVVAQEAVQVVLAAPVAAPPGQVADDDARAAGPALSSSSGVTP